MRSLYLTPSFGERASGSTDLSWRLRKSGTSRPPRSGSSQSKPSPEARYRHLFACAGLKPEEHCEQEAETRHDECGAQRNQDAVLLVSTNAKPLKEERHC